MSTSLGFRRGPTKEGVRLNVRRVVFAVTTAVIALVGLPSATAGAAVAGGAVLAHGAPDHGSTAGAALNAPIVGMAAAADGSGYYQVASDGGVFTFGGARYAGSLGAIPLNQPITGIAPTPTGGGYWLVAADGGVFTFGDAAYLGSAGGSPPSHRVIGLVPTGSGRGYWLVTEGGQVIAFGTARHLGDRLGQTSSPVVGLAPARDSHGYWLASADGSVHAFGTALFAGSLAGQRLDEPVTAIDGAAAGAGYYLVTRDGAVHTFGGAPFAGSSANACKDAVLDIEARRGGGYWLGTAPLAPATWPPGTHPLDQLAAEERQLTSLLRIRQGCQPGASPQRGLLAHPLPGARRTGSYGPRTHPVYRRPQFHTGSDFAGGSTVRAALGGTVVEVRTRTGYGLTVVIDHGNGIATTYSHLARAAVGPGQTVTTGQSVGTVGSSGYATGDHLHFEVRVHGAHTDPGSWI
jgi:murein DD-endopeptidase MepM/ murein hydrolase activator NlpD